MSKFIQTHFFHHFTFPLPTKQKEEKINFFISSHYFLFSHFSTPPTKWTLEVKKLQEAWIKVEYDAILSVGFDALSPLAMSLCRQQAR